MKNDSNFKKFWQCFWRSWSIQASWNYERHMNMGFLYGIVPTLDRLYPDNNDLQQVAYKKDAYAAFGAEHFGEASRQAVLDMIADIRRVL